jgi:transcriptional regulator GlxA family with amidase domain
VCTGAFLAARIGLLDGCRATTHWAFAAELGTRFPAVDVDPEPIFVRSSAKVWTAAGVTAASTWRSRWSRRTTAPSWRRRWRAGSCCALRRPGGQTQFAAPVWMPRARCRPIRDVQEAIEAEPGADHTVTELAVPR